MKDLGRTLPCSFHTLRYAFSNSLWKSTFKTGALGITTVSLLFSSANFLTISVRSSRIVEVNVMECSASRYFSHFFSIWQIGCIKQDVMVFIIDSLFWPMIMVEPQASSVSLQMVFLDFMRSLWHAISVRKVSNAEFNERLFWKQRSGTASQMWLRASPDKFLLPKKRWFFFNIILQHNFKSILPFYMSLYLLEKL